MAGFREINSYMEKVVKQIDFSKYLVFSSFCEDPELNLTFSWIPCFVILYYN